KIQRFNKAKPEPDILEEEKIYAYPSNITSETGFRTISGLEEIVEKQGDTIEYLKRHNALLSKRGTSRSGSRTAAVAVKDTGKTPVEPWRWQLLNSNHSKEPQHKIPGKADSIWFWPHPTIIKEIIKIQQFFCQRGFNAKMSEAEPPILRQTEEEPLGEGSQQGAGHAIFSPTETK
ncbi:hypothetical protein H8959_008866, partial [Pygathrix nigripes]